MKISIDKDKCIKCGLCASINPGVFVLKEDGIEIIHKDEGPVDKKVDEKLVDDLKMAEINCPVRAIAVEENSKK